MNLSLFDPLPLSDQQQQFVEHFSARFVQRSLLVGMGGTGKTTTALRAADRLLGNDEVDKLLVITGTRSLASQWQQSANSSGYELATNLSIAEGQVGAAVTMARLSHHENWVRWVDEHGTATRWLLIVEDIEWFSDARILQDVDQVLAQNPASRALFVGRIAPPPLRGQASEFVFGSEFFSREALVQPETHNRLRLLAPSYTLIHEIQRDLSRLDELSWRDFEKLVATLLERDGYVVDLMKGTKDGGVDVVATKDMGSAGLFKSVWQAKKNRIDRRIGLPVVRELADTRMEHGANKAVIVTTSYLTAGARARVERDRFLMGKVDRDDLAQWVERTLRS